MLCCLLILLLVIMASATALTPLFYRQRYSLPGSVTVSRSRVSELRRVYDPNPAESERKLQAAIHAAMSPRACCSHCNPPHSPYKPLGRRFVQPQSNNQIARDVLGKICDFLEIRDLSRFPVVSQIWHQGALTSINYQLVHSIKDTIQLRDEAYEAIKSCYYRRDGLFKYCILRWTQGGEIFSQEQNTHLQTLHHQIKSGSMRPGKNQKNAQLMAANGAKTAARSALVRAWAARNKSIELARSSHIPARCAPFIHEGIGETVPPAEGFVDRCLRGKPLPPKSELNPHQRTWENYAADALGLAWNYRGTIIAMTVGAYFGGMRQAVFLGAFYSFTQVFNSVL